MQLLAVHCGLWRNSARNYTVTWTMSHLYYYIAEWKGQKCALRTKPWIHHKNQMSAFTQNSEIHFTNRQPTHGSEKGLKLRKCSCCRPSQWCCLCYKVCTAARQVDFPIVLTNNGKQTCPLYSLFLTGSLFHPPLFFFASAIVIITLSSDFHLNSCLVFTFLRSQFFNQTMKWLQRLAEQSPPHCSSEVLMWKEGDEGWWKWENRGKSKEGRRGCRQARGKKMSGWEQDKLSSEEKRILEKDEGSTSKLERGAMKWWIGMDKNKGLRSVPYKSMYETKGRRAKIERSK